MSVAVSQAIGSEWRLSVSRGQRFRLCDWSSEGDEGVVGATACNDADHEYESDLDYGGR